MMKIAYLALLAVSLSGLAACDEMYDPTLHPDYAIQVVPTGAGKSIAVPPTCASWSQDIKDPYDNQSDPTFGCATARNLAQIVDNPNDLVEGRTLGNARGVTEVGAIKRYDNNQPRGLIIPGSETSAVAATTAASAASTLTGDTSSGAASTTSTTPSSSSSAAAAP